MRELLELLQGPVGEGNVSTLEDVVLGMTLCLMCTVVIGWVYRFTHKSVSYSQSFVQTLVLVSLVTTLIMIVIGSNIARGAAESFAAVSVHTSTATSRGNQ